MLPVETVKEIARMAAEASPARRIVPAPAEPKNVYYVVDEGGGLEKVWAEDPPERAAADDLETVAAWLRQPGINLPEVWYSRAAVVAGTAPGRESANRCTLTLAPSPQLAALANWDKAGRAHLPQADLVVLLRTLFADCHPDHPQLLSIVRNVQSKKAEDVTSKIEHGKVSLGRAMVAEMSGLGAVPEEVTFTVPVFAAAAVPFRERVRVAVDPDPKNERFTLIVLPGQVEAAYAAAEARLAARLRELVGPDVPLYRGTP